MFPRSTRTLEEHTGPPVDHGTPAAPLCIVESLVERTALWQGKMIKTTGHTPAQRRCGVCPRHQRRCPRACIGACVCLPADSDRGVRPHTRSKPRPERAASLVWGFFTVWGDRYALDVCFMDTPPVLQGVSWERHAPAWLLEPGWSPAFPGWHWHRRYEMDI